MAVATMDGVRFVATTRTAAIAARGIEQTMTERDCWVSANPMRADIAEGCKGGAREVARLACIYADLDVKPGGMPAWDAGHAVIDTLTGMLGVDPAAVVMTGHGLQPVWRVAQEPGRTDWPDADAPAFAQAQSLAQRFGRLVQTVAQRHDGAVDNVSNLDRVLRAPGTTNRKGEPIRTTLQLGRSPCELTLDRLAETLDEYAVPTTDAPRAVPDVDRCDLDAAEVAHRTYYARDVIEKRLTDLDTLALLPWESRPAGWDSTTHAAACRIIELLNTPGVDLDPEAVHAAFLARAPRDAKWKDGPERKWTAAQGTVGSKATTIPPKPATLDDMAGSTTGALDPGDFASPSSSAPAAAAPFDDEAFWNSHTQLQHVYTFALARMTSPWAVLGAVLLRLLCSIPPTVQLPPTIGKNASLNLLVAGVGPSGSGKGAALGCAEDAVTLGGLDFPTMQLGSGEGIAHAYARMIPAKDGKPAEVDQVRKSVLFEVGEVDMLAALLGRNSSTLGPALRGLAMGERLGHAYVAADKRVSLAPHTYRAGLFVGVQPERADVLLDGSDGGTPQRFLWMPATDARITADTPPEPEPLHIASQTWMNGSHVLALPPEVAIIVKEAQAARNRGQGDALDGHAILTRLKVTTALTFLLGRRTLTVEVWDMAGVVMAVSDRTRGSVQATLARKMQQANETRGKAAGHQQVVAQTVQEEATEKRVAAAIRRKLTRSADSVSRGEVRRGLSSPDRSYFEPALDALVTAGAVEIRCTDSGKRLILRADQ